MQIKSKEQLYKQIGKYTLNPVTGSLNNLHQLINSLLEAEYSLEVWLKHDNREHLVDLRRMAYDFQYEANRVWEATDNETVKAGMERVIKSFANARTKLKPVRGTDINFKSYDS